MRAVIQRVSSADVAVEGRPRAAIGAGLVILLGVREDDGDGDADWLAQKIAAVRIFPDGMGKMNRSVVECGGGIIVVSQFTLLASLRKGTRPSFHLAAKPEKAVPLYEAFLQKIEAALGKPVGAGVFGAHMTVALVNDGPVTLVIDSKQRD